MRIARHSCMDLVDTYRHLKKKRDEIIDAALFKYLLHNNRLSLVQFVTLEISTVIPWNLAAFLKEYLFGL